MARPSHKREIIAMKSDIIDIEGTVHHRTERAVLFSKNGNRASAQWLPLAQIEVEHSRHAGIIIVTLPEWLAMEKGFI